MSKNNIKNSIWFVLADGLKIYFSNIDKFLSYMLFPVLGQFCGIILAFGLSLGFAEKITQRFDNPLVALGLVLLLAMPGLLIFVKAFWDYMVAYVALNSMTEGALTSGKVYDFQSHNEVATRKAFKFVLFLIVVGALSSIATSIFFIIPGFVLWIYFVLIFQVFTFEDDMPIQDYFKRSFVLIRGNWLRTFILLFVLIFFTIYILTVGVSVIFDYLNITDKLCLLFTPITNTIPLDFTNKVLTYFHYPIITPELISKSLFYTILSALIMGLTLPIRSICWSLWYLSLSEQQEKSQKKRTKKGNKNEEDE
jgi:hypothetical protein